MFTEYCESETFSPVCNDNEVVVIESAIYGRMKFGRCISIDFGFIGCSSNLLKQLDGMCSGFNKCMIVIPNSFLETYGRNCPEDLKQFFEVSYRCQRGKY